MRARALWIKIWVKMMGEILDRKDRSNRKLFSRLPNQNGIKTRRLDTRREVEDQWDETQEMLISHLLMFKDITLLLKAPFHQEHLVHKIPSLQAVGKMKRVNKSKMVKNQKPKLSLSLFIPMGSVQTQIS